MLYPLIEGLQIFSMVDLNTVEILWGLLDYFTKAIFARALAAANMVSLDEAVRAAAASRAALPAYMYALGGDLQRRRRRTAVHAAPRHHNRLPLLNLATGTPL